MSGGRPAALPEPGWEPPQRMFLSGEECRVRFFPTPQGAPRDFDFAALPVSRTLQVALARAFDGHVGPAGTVGSADSASNIFRVLRLFAEVVAECDPTPQAQGDLQPALLDRYVLKRKALAGLPFELGLLKAVLRKMDRLNPRFVNALAAPTTIARELGSRAGSYTEGEERRILQAARTMLRQAADRIRGNHELLERWRDGDPEILADARQEEYCRVLDLVDRAGELPRRENSPSCLLPWIRQHGNVEELTHALHPRTCELAAGALLLVRLTGHNGSTICNAPAVHHRPDGFAATTPTALVEVVKARRGTRRFMTVALSDLPAWAAAPSQRVALSGRDELHTAFGVYMLLLDLTSSARRITGSDRLMVSWTVRGKGTGQGFRIGLRPSVLDQGGWSAAAGLMDDPAPGETEPRPMPVSFARMRMTHLQREQRPVAHTDKTLANEYLARDVTAFTDYQKVVADVLAAETVKARAVGRVAALSQKDVEEARADPQAAARRHGVSVEMLKRLIAGQFDTVLAGCVDNTAGPFDPPGEPCTASFLKCLGCPCARALPQHLPVQAIALETLEARRGQMTPLRWAQRFGQPHAQLSDLLDRVPEGALEHARESATDVDRRLVERLLARELDHL